MYFIQNTGGTYSIPFNDCAYFFWGTYYVLALYHCIFKRLVCFQSLFVDSCPTSLGRMSSESIFMFLSRYNSRYCTHLGSSIWPTFWEI